MARAAECERRGVGKGAARQEDRKVAKGSAVVGLDDDGFAAARILMAPSILLRWLSRLGCVWFGLVVALVKAERGKQAVAFF